MLEDLKKRVYEANMELVSKGLVTYTWGNASAISRENRLVVIKPSGADYNQMKEEDMVVVDFKGNTIEGKLKPSSDTPTHLFIYKNFLSIGGIVHTHSEWATSWAQAGMSIQVMGTTHADYFYGDIPCTRHLNKNEIKSNYEVETGRVIIEAFKDIDPIAIPSVLVNGHAPFSWGKDVEEAVHNAVVLEQVAKMAHHTILLNKNGSIDQKLLDKHYKRKHGLDSYYGQ